MNEQRGHAPTHQPRTLVAGDRLVPWDGQLRANWTVVPLKSVVKTNVLTLGEGTDADREIQYVDIGNVTSEGEVLEIATHRFAQAPSRARRILRAGDTIISTVRTYLKAIAFIPTEKGGHIASTGFAVLSPGDKVHPKYLYYWVRSDFFVDEISARSVGVSYPAINASEIGALPFPVVPIEEQHAIADFLDARTSAIDAVIRKKERLIELLQEKRQSVITRAVTKGLDPTVPMKDSGVEWLAEIPANWKVERLKNLKLGAFVYGANEAADIDDPAFPRFIRITDINQDGSLREDTFRSLPPEVAAPYLLREGDILLARSGATVGKAFIYYKEWGEACFAGYLIRLRTDRSKALPQYLILYTQSHGFRTEVQLSTIQATIQNVSAERYGLFVVALPPLERQRHVVAFVEKELTKIATIERTLEAQLHLMRQYRQTLITAAVTGKIDVRSWQDRVVTAAETAGVPA